MPWSASEMPLRSNSQAWNRSILAARGSCQNATGATRSCSRDRSSNAPSTRSSCSMDAPSHSSSAVISASRRSTALVTAGRSPSPAAPLMAAAPFRLPALAWEPDLAFFFRDPMAPWPHPGKCYRVQHFLDRPTTAGRREASQGTARAWEAEYRRVGNRLG